MCHRCVHFKFSLCDFLWVFLQSLSNWFWCDVNLSPTHTHSLTELGHVKNSACIILHEFKVLSRLNLVSYPHNMCSWVQTVCQSGLSRHALLFSTMLHEMKLWTYIFNDNWCHAGVTSWTLYHRITAHSAHACGYLHGPLCVVSFSLARCM